LSGLAEGVKIWPFCSWSLKNAREKQGLRLVIAFSFLEKVGGNDESRKF